MTFIKGLSALREMGTMAGRVTTLCSALSLTDVDDSAVTRVIILNACVSCLESVTMRIFPLCVLLPELCVIIACSLHCLAANGAVLNAVTLQMYLNFKFMVLTCKITISYVLQKTYVSEEVGEV